MKLTLYEGGKDERLLEVGVSVQFVGEDIERYLKKLNIKSLHLLRNGLFSFIDCVGCHSRTSAKFNGGWFFPEGIVLNYHCDICDYDITVRRKNER